MTQLHPQPPSPPPLDQWEWVTDRPAERIVNVMWRFPTASYRDIGKAVGLSGAQVHLITKQLKLDGVVTVVQCPECRRPMYAVAEPS
jgi:hypothetical protein